MYLFVLDGGFVIFHFCDLVSGSSRNDNTLRNVEFCRTVYYV